MSQLSAVTLNALLNDQARLERVATNIANVTTPGYKRELWVERAGSFAQLMTGSEAVAPGNAPTSAASARDDRPGTLRATGQPLDLALSGPGYFELATNHGPAYTRAGQFQLDARGRIVNAAGHALIGTGGEITATSGQLTIDAVGRVMDGTRQVGQLRIVDWPSGAMRPLGGGLYAASGTARAQEMTDTRVHQGHLENANVDNAREMVALTATVRHFEAVLRAAQGRDELLGSALRKLGEY